MSPPQKVIIITGASRGEIRRASFPTIHLIIFVGIGLAATKYLLEQKCKVVVVARGQAALEEIKSQHPDDVAILAGNLEDLSLGAKVVDLTLKTFRRLDGIIINHGVLAPVTRISESNAEDWSKAFSINVFSAVAIVR